MTINTKRFALFAFVMILQQLNCESVKKSVSTSTFAMKVLLEIERQLLSAMENFTTQLESKLNIIRGALNEMRAENIKSEIDPEQYLSNPINSYALIRRLHEDWVNWELYFRRTVGEDIIKRVETLRDDIPDKSDLMEAAVALYRISAVYNIRPADMAAGLLNNRQYNARFTSIDCYSLGCQLFKIGLYYNAENWLNVSLRLYRDSDRNVILDFHKINILQLHAQVLLKLNRSIDALDTINNALRLCPDKAELLCAKTQVERIIATSTKVETKREGTVQKENQSEDIVHSTEQIECREYVYRSKLYCLYNKTTTAFLQLAPLKMEILQLDPYMVLYHDVISDAEIAEMKDISANELKRATVFDASANKMVVNNVRTAHGHWLLNNSISVINRINQRIIDMSGFDLRDSEPIQTLNYGMGGHYLTHADWFGKNNENSPLALTRVGDRIATVLFYMSNVEQGGATVFPKMQLGLFPKKGTALMWYNLNARGEGNNLTEHGACPVVVGSKWVFTKWISEYSQMFKKPCYA